MKSKSVCMSGYQAAESFCGNREGAVLTAKPTYKELQQRIETLEKQLAECAKVEETLKAEQERYRRLYDRAPLAYQSIDEKGKLIEVNEAWLDMLGYARSEVIGRSMAEFLEPEWREHFMMNFPRFKSVGEILGAEFALRAKNGDTLLVSVYGKIGYDKEGNFRQTHCILQDITERDRTDRIRDQIVADLHGKIIRQEQKFSLLAECEICREKLKQYDK